MDPLASVRAIHFAACILLLAGPVFSIWTLPPDLRTARAGVILRKRLDRLMRWAALAALLSGIAGFGLLARSLIEETEVGLLTLFTQTQMGHLFLLRAALMAVFLGVAWAGGSQRLLAALAAGILGSLAWAGHAAACCSSPWGVVVDLVHLLAAGVWPGGLVPLAIYLSTLPGTKAPADFASAARTVRRFSLLSIAGVAALAASGVGNACLILGSFGPVLTTTYGHLLATKLVFFVALMVVAAGNLLFLCPRLRTDPETSLSAIRRNVLVELSLGICVVFVVGLLGMTAPR